MVAASGGCLETVDEDDEWNVRGRRGGVCGGEGGGSRDTDGGPTPQQGCAKG
jgi:hypothetical protein